MNRKAISAFDLDRTLLKDNSSYCFGRYLCREKLLPYSALFVIFECTFRHSIGLLPIEKLHQRAFARLFQGRSHPLIRQCAREFVDKHLERMLYSPAVEELKKAQNEGHITALLSSGPDFLVEEIAARFKIPIWHSTQYAVDKDHQFCHISSLMLGKDKAQILEDLRCHYGIEKQDSYAYSDSHLDLPFLQAAGHAIGVNPNRQLRTFCRQNQWPMI